MMILETNEKIPNNQIIAYDDSLTFKRQILFPAVTIIPEVFISRDYYDLYISLSSTKQEELKKKFGNESFKNDTRRYSHHQI
jgi:hypothetical protein